MIFKPETKIEVFPASNPTCYSLKANAKNNTTAS